MPATSSEPLKVYWQPGCSSCLRAKEFLNKHNVVFVSINVREDQQGFEELAALGLRRVPVIRRGEDWVDGQVLADIARIAGIDWGKPEPLGPDILAERIAKILTIAQGLLAQMPEEKLDVMFAQRPYSYRQHACHIFRIVEAFLDNVERGKRLEFSAYSNDIPSQIRTTKDLLAFGESIARRFDAWRKGAAKTADYRANADVYYGEQTLHEFLERTTWHAAQHTRQLMLVVESLGIIPAAPITQDDIAGLPIPENVWDDKLKFG